MLYNRYKNRNILTNGFILEKIESDTIFPSLFPKIKSKTYSPKKMNIYKIIGMQKIIILFCNKTFNLFFIAKKLFLYVNQSIIFYQSQYLVSTELI